MAKSQPNHGERISKFESDVGEMMEPQRRLENSQSKVEELLQKLTDVGDRRSADTPQRNPTNRVNADELEVTLILEILSS